VKKKKQETNLDGHTIHPGTWEPQHRPVPIMDRGRRDRKKKTPCGGNEHGRDEKQYWKRKPPKNVAYERKKQGEKITYAHNRHKKKKLEQGMGFTRSGGKL